MQIYLATLLCLYISLCGCGSIDNNVTSWIGNLTHSIEFSPPQSSSEIAKLERNFAHKFGKTQKWKPGIDPMASASAQPCLLFQNYWVSKDRYVLSGLIFNKLYYYVELFYHFVLASRNSLLLEDLHLLYTLSCRVDNLLMQLSRIKYLYCELGIFSPDTM